MEELLKRDWWERRDGIDLWSIPHTLFGVMMAFTPYFLDLSSQEVLAITIGLAILWEFFEPLIGVKESSINAFLDVFFSILGYMAASTALAAYQLSQEDLVKLCIAIASLYAVLLFLGWLAYRRRSKDRS